MKPKEAWNNLGYCFQSIDIIHPITGEKILLANISALETVVIKQALNRLDELEAKATMLDKLLAKSMPRIPNGCKNDWGCPTCDSTIEYDDFDYCPRCGQKLDWGK